MTHKWIPVEQRLPASPFMCLVKVKDSNTKLFVYKPGWYSPKFDTWYSSADDSVGDRIKDVKAWIPYPEEL